MNKTITLLISLMALCSVAFSANPITTIGSAVLLPDGHINIPVSVRNFNTTNNVAAISQVLYYDPAVLSYLSVTPNPELPKNGKLDINDLIAGKFILGRFGDAITLDDNSVIFTLHFKLLQHASGTNAAISFSTLSGEREYAASNGTVIAGCVFNDLSWTIQNHFRSLTTGNWSNLLTWEYSFNGISNWASAAFEPTGFDNVVIISNHRVTIAGPKTCKDLAIQPNAELTISALQTLTASGAFIVQSDATGTGSFIPIGTFLSTGTTTVQKYLTNDRWWYIGSPMLDGHASAFGTLSSTVNTGNRLFNWNEAGQAYVNVTNTADAMPPAAGYAFKSFGASPVTVLFTGTLNTGIKGGLANLTRVTAAPADGYNLVSNPYPSAVNFDVAHLGITPTNLETTLWYRTNSKFATWNWTNGAGVNNGQPVIPAMQAFWVSVATGNLIGGLQLENTARVHNSQVFYKSSAATNLFRMNVSDGTTTDEMVVGFWAAAKDTYEDYDSRKMFVTDENVPQTYSLTSDAAETAINGQPELSQNEARIVPVGFSTPVAGTFSFNATNLNSFDTAIPVYLKDAQTHVVTDLRQTAKYTFASGIIKNASRFSLQFGNSTTTDIAVEAKTSVSIYAQGKMIYVNIPEAGKSQVEIFSISGQKISSRPSVQGLNTIQVNVNTGIYIVKVQNGTGIVTKRVMIAN